MVHHQLVDRFPNAAYRAGRVVERTRGLNLWQRALAAFGFTFIVTTLAFLTVGAFTAAKEQNNIALGNGIEIEVPSRVASRVDERILLERQRYASNLNKQLNQNDPPAIGASERHANLPDPTLNNEIETSSVEIAIPPRPIKRPVQNATTKRGKSKNKKSLKGNSKRLANRTLSTDRLTKPNAKNRKVELDGPRLVTATAGKDIDLPLAIIDPSGRTKKGQVIVGGLPPKATIDLGKSTGSGTWRVPARDSDIAVIRVPAGTKKDFRLTLALRAPGIDPPLIRRVQVKVVQPPAPKQIPVAQKIKTPLPQLKVVIKPKPEPKVVIVAKPKPTRPPLDPGFAAEITNTGLNAQSQSARGTMVIAPQRALPVSVATPDVPTPIEINPTKTVSTDPTSGVGSALKPAETPARSPEVSSADDKSVRPRRPITRPKIVRITSPKPKKAQTKKRVVKSIRKSKPKGGYDNLGWDPFQN